MHVVVSWDIEAKGKEWNDLNTELKECLSGYSWVKPLSTLYIVQVEDSEDRTCLKESLSEVCKGTPKTIHFVISPIMRGGSYGGWLPKSLWPKIRKRAEG